MPRTENLREAALRGLAVGVRGVLEGKRMQREARTPRERRIADAFYRTKALALEEKEADFEEAFNQEQPNPEQVKLAQQEELDTIKQEKTEYEKLLREDFAAEDENIHTLWQDYHTAVDDNERVRIKSKINTGRRRRNRIANRLGIPLTDVEFEQDAAKPTATAAAEPTAPEASQLEPEPVNPITAIVDPKPPVRMDFSTTQGILDSYKDIPNKRVLNSIGNVISSKNEAQYFLRSAHRWLEGRPFEEVDENSKQRVGKLFINEIMENVAGGDIVKRQLRAYKILKDQLPALLADAAQLQAKNKNLGRLTQTHEGIWRWESGSSDPEVTALRRKLTDALNGYIALRSEAEISEAERAFHDSMFAEIGSGYEANKATIERLTTNVLRDLSAIYKGVMGPEWGEYATTIEFQQDTEPADVWISEVLNEYELRDKRDVVVPSGTNNVIQPSQAVEILAEGAGSIMKAKNLTPTGYEKSVEAQLRKRYPNLSDDEQKGLMDDFREKMDSSEIEDEVDTSFDRAPKETDFKHTAEDGVEYDLHAEVAYMIDIDGWSREQIKAHLQKDYPELSDGQIETLLNDPEFTYPGDEK